MTSTCSKLALVLGFALASVPAIGAAQSSDDSSETAAEEAEDGEDEQTDESAEQSTQGDDSDEDDAQGEQASDEGDSSSEADGEEGSEQDEDGAADDQERAEGDEQSPETGPGGRKLRDDYPARDEAKEGQMETDRIEGLQFKEGQDPSQAYDVQIQELETRIDDLKESVFQSKSRVVLLKETVLGGNLSGSRALIKHVDGLGGRFKLQRAMYSLDGNRVFNKSTDSGDLPGSKEFSVYDDSVTNGQHNVSVLLEYRGSGFGIFNYMEGYRFKITSSCQFTAEAGKATILRIHAVDKAGAFADVEKKPGIRCEIKKRDLSDQNSEEVASSSSASSDSSAAQTEGDGESGGDGD